MKTISIKGKKFSKVVLGTNAIYGRSHFSDARDREYVNRCNDEYIKALINKCMDLGINAVETSANERIIKLVSEIESISESKLYLIGNTRIDQTSQMKSHNDKFNFLLYHKSDICVIHSQFVDRSGTELEIRGLKKLIDKIHSAGLIAGISTHRNSTVDLCEELEYGVDVYLFPLNKKGFVYPGYDGDESVESRVKLINRIPKPFVLMKALGAGRIPPEDGLRFVLENSKPNDIITLGLSSIEEAEESISIIREYIDIVT